MILSNQPFLLLQQLVSIPTITDDPAASSGALDSIAAFLNERGLHVSRHVIEGAESIVATTRRTKTPAIMLVGHIDVVAAPADQFAVREKDNRLYGRGVFDMKGAIAGYLLVADKLQEQLGEYDFGIMITSDEECRGPSATELLKLGYRPGAAILLDGARDWQIESAAKGSWAIEITVGGKTAHSSRPWEGDSAALKAMTIINEIKALFPDQTPDSRVFCVSSIQAGTVGEAINQIPDTAKVVVDMRVLNDEELRPIKQAVKLICNRYDATYRQIALHAPLQHDTTLVCFKEFARSVEAITGIQPGYVLSGASSDATFFAEFGVPCVVTYPIGGGHHSNNEWLDKQSYIDIPNILIDYLERMARKPLPKLAQATKALR